MFFRQLLILHFLGLLEGLHRKLGVPNSIYSHVRFFSVNVIALITITVKFKRKRKNGKRQNTELNEQQLDYVILLKSITRQWKASSCD